MPAELECAPAKESCMHFSRLRKLVRHLCHRSQRTPSRVRLRASPGVHLLEDRCLLSTFITEFPLSTPVDGFTAGPDGNLWFTETWANKVGRMTPSGQL